MSPQQRYTAVSDEQCTHCGAKLGAGRGRCWWCLQAFGDWKRGEMAESACQGENAFAFAPKSLSSLLSSGGVFYTFD